MATAKNAKISNTRSATKTTDKAATKNGAKGNTKNAPAVEEVITFIAKKLPMISKQRTTTPTGEPLYVVAKCSYGHWTKFGRHIASGLARTELKDGLLRFGTVEGKTIASHRQFGTLVNKGQTKYATEKPFDGLVICTEKDIPAVTKNIQSFFNDPKNAGITKMFTMYRDCQPFDNTDLANVTNKSVPLPAVTK